MPHRTVIVGLAAVLIAFLAVVHSQTSPAWFGYYHDDSLYWSAALSLAEGEGYRMASVPGEPPQTKYPVAFPLLLSGVWRVQPEFPANIEPALWVMAAIGTVFLAGAFVLLQQLGLPPGAALFLTAVCAVHPVLVHLSGQLLSDVPFMAVAVWSLALAHNAIERQGSPGAWRWWAGALVLAGLAVSLRSIGVTLLAGIALAAGLRRCYRPALACLLLLGPVLFVPVLTAVQDIPSSSRVVSDGYEQTMEFYSSYLGFWKLSTPDWKTFWALLIFNLKELWKEPSILAFILPASGYASFGWQVAATVISCAMLRGLYGLGRQVRHPALMVLGLYAAVVLVWNYTLMDRFFAWALPLFLAGAWFEVRRLVATTGEVFRRGPMLDRCVAAAVMAGVAALCLYSGYRYVRVAPQSLVAQREQRRAIQAEKRQAYQWIRRNTVPDDRFIASEDASLYLFTGRQALRPMAFSTAAFYLQSEAPLRRDLEQITDTACEIGARYWLTASDDYHLESAQEWIQRRSEEVLEGRRAVFVSRDRNVRIYDIAGLTAAGGEGSRACVGRRAKPSSG